jgi:flagellar basal body rod protein FlgG
MDGLLIAAASGIRSRMESLDLIANNLSNASTAGYKMDRESFSLYRADDVDADWITRLPLVEKNWVDQTQGNLVHTANPSHVALSGKGFLVAESPAGPLLTRSGNLKLSPEGELQTTEGHRLRNIDDNKKPILLDRSLAWEIDRDGRVLQSGQVVARIETADVSDPQELRKAGSTYFAFDPAASRPASLEFRQGYLESANVGEAESAVRMVGVLRQFEMLQRALTLGGDMNRRAIEDVARV